MKGALLFDLDGTLTDPREGIIRSLRYALESVGAPVPDEQKLLTWIGPPLHQSLREYLAPTRADDLAGAVTAYRERFVAQGMFENVTYPGVPAALEELKCRGWTLHVATSKPRVFAEKILQHFGLYGYFSSVHGAELSGERSDKGELIAHLLGTERISPANATMIGDREHDIIGARRNEVRAVGVLWGYGDRAELTAAGADQVVGTISELVASLP